MHSEHTKKLLARPKHQARNKLESPSFWASLENNQPKISMNIYSEELLNLSAPNFSDKLTHILFNNRNIKFISALSIPVEPKCSLQAWFNYLETLVCFLATMSQEDIDEFILSFNSYPQG
jgi:hypothetical protein